MEVRTCLVDDLLHAALLKHLEVLLHLWRQRLHVPSRLLYLQKKKTLHKVIIVLVQVSERFQGGIRESSF